MKYRNTRTGAVIETPCAIAGKEWESAEAKAPADKPAAQGKKPRKTGKKATS